jgi:hypothetical protein
MKSIIVAVVVGFVCFVLGARLMVEFMVKAVEA